MGEDVRAAPYEAERAQARGMEQVQHVEARVDRLGALDMHHGREAAAFHGGADVGNAPADREIGRKGAFEPQQDGEHVGGRSLGGVERQKRRQGYVIAGPLQGLVELRHDHGRREGREESPREAACPGARQIQVATTVALSE